MARETNDHAAGATGPPRHDLVRAVMPGAHVRSGGGEDGMPTMHGHLAVFNVWAEINNPLEGHFMERIAPGAFAKTISENRQSMKVLYDHGDDATIGRKPLGKIAELSEDDKGCYYEVALLNTAYNQELLPGLKQGLYGSSFRIKSVVREDYVHRPGVSAHNPKGLPERTVREFSISEFGPTPFPAYTGTEPAVRSLTDRFHRTATPDREYKRSSGYVASTVWAIDPPALETIVGIIAERKSGIRLTEQEIRERIESSARAQSPFDELPAAPDDVEVESGVAVINLFGTIMPRADLFSRMSGASSIESFQEEFRTALADPDVKSILLNIDSPGGSSDLVPEMAAEIREARGQKPIWAIANVFAASAAYWIASACDVIVVTPSGMVGSIGVYSAHTDISEAQKKLGVKTSLISAGRFKVENNPFEPLTEEGQAEIQRKVDALYKTFVEAVAEGRGVTAEKVEADFGQGRMMLPEDAVAVGAADRVATLDEAIALLEPKPAKRSQTPPESGSEDGATLTRHEGSSAGDTVHHPPEEGRAGDTVHHPAQPTETTEVKTMDTKDRMSTEQLVARGEEIKREIKTIDDKFAGQILDDEARAAFDELVAERTQIAATLKDIEARQSAIEQMDDLGAGEPGDGAAAARTRIRVPGLPGNGNVPGNIFDLGEYRTRAGGNFDKLRSALQDGAKRAIETATIPHPNADSDATKAHIERLIETIDNERGDFSRYILTVGSPQYARAFGLALSGQQLTRDQDDLLAQGQRAQRAMSLTGANGGFAVPITVDPTVILTSNGAVNPLRQISRRITITGNTWEGVSSAGVTASYDAESTEVSDDTPTLAQPTANVEKAQAFIPFTIEIGEDWPGFQSEMARLLQDAKDTLESTKFMSGAGHGSHEPEGLLTGATNTVHTGGTTNFGIEDLYALAGALPDRYQPNAELLGNRAIFNLVRQMDTAGGANLWVQLSADQPPLLLGYPAHRASALDSTVTSGHNLMVIGDFNYFAVIDRVGMSIELIPHLFATANNRPSGQRGLYAYWRNTSKVLTPAAFRVLVAAS